MTSEPKSKYEEEIDDLFESARSIDGEYFIIKILKIYGELIK